MPVYRYEATAQGRKSAGYVTADTPSAGRRVLRKRGFAIARFETRESTSGPRKPGLFQRPPGRGSQGAIDEFTHYLSMLLRAGVPLAEGLDVLIRQSPRQIEPMLRRISERVSGGTDFAEALAEEKGAFDAAYIGIVRVGLASGMIEQCLDRLVRLRRRQRALRQRLQAALAYPAVVASVGVIVVIFLMAFVVPKITGVLTQMGRTLPLPTRILMGISDAMVGYGWAALLAGAAGIVAIRFGDHRKRVSTWLRRVLLRLPVLGPLMMKAGIAQTAAMLETALRSGLPLDQAISLSREATANPLLKAEMGRMQEALRSGRPLIESSRGRTVLPPVVRHMLSVGEQTGQLEEMLEELSSFYDQEVEVASRQAVSLLEPILIVIMSCIVGFIVLATLLPILRISGSL